jgi:hypothetical protein
VLRPDREWCPRYGRIRCPRDVLWEVWIREHLAFGVLPNSQYSFALQQSGSAPKLVWQMRPPEQQTPPWQISLA